MYDLLDLFLKLLERLEDVLSLADLCPAFLQVTQVLLFLSHKRNDIEGLVLRNGKAQEMPVLPKPGHRICGKPPPALDLRYRHQPTVSDPSTVIGVVASELCSDSRVYSVTANDQIRLRARTIFEIDENLISSFLRFGQYVESHAFCLTYCQFLTPAICMEPSSLSLFHDGDK